MEASIYSLIPPVLALAMVMATRKVLLSLGVGIGVGLLMLNHFNPVRGVVQLYHIVKGVFIVDGGLNTENVYILIFLVFLGMIATLISIAGGSRAFGNWATKRIKTRKGATFVPVVLGLIIFIDDYFNALTVGNVSKPITDRHRISRAKLAYMVDSTSAPVCVLMPISSWGAYIIATVSGIFTAHSVHTYGSLEAFVRMIPMNYYAIIALLMVLAVAFLNLDFGSMKKHEQRAINEGVLTDPNKGVAPGEDEELPVNENGKIRDLIWPIVILIAATVFFMIVTGIQETKGTASLLSIFENTVVPTSLLLGGIIGWIAAMVVVVQRKTENSHILQGMWGGIKSMLPAIYILLFAWTIIDVIDDLGTGTYLADIVKHSSISLSLLPMLIFLISAFMAFSTGTSWGTFGIMLPIAANIAAATDISLLLPVLSCVLAGGIFGDHCSPISDTTILSSAGTGIHHIDHVMTQIPYAVLIALISAVGYLVLGLTDSTMLGLLVSVLLLIIMVLILRRQQTPQAG